MVRSKQEQREDRKRVRHKEGKKRELESRAPKSGRPEATSLPLFGTEVVQMIED